jgi:hypothetical protein
MSQPAIIEAFVKPRDPRRRAGQRHNPTIVSSLVNKARSRPEIKECFCWATTIVNQTINNVNNLSLSIRYEFKQSCT